MQSTSTKVIKIDGYNIATYSIGDSSKVLLLLHGGPGSPCEYLFESHKHFIESGFRVVSYDQLGCGKSDQPDDGNLWNIERFVNELEQVRASLNLGEVYLLGHSWGGILGLEYCLQFPQNVKGFMAINIGFDVPHMQRGFEKKKLALGQDTCTMMALREAEGTITHPEYQAAMTILMYRHMCRLEKWPDSVVNSMNNIGKKPWDAMFGKYFFNCTGSLSTYNSLPKLNQVQVPVLLTTSEFDYIIPELACISNDHIKNSKLVIFRNCSHTPFYEDPETYTDTLLEFLQSLP